MHLAELRDRTPSYWSISMRRPPVKRGAMAAYLDGRSVPCAARTHGADGRRAAVPGGTAFISAVGMTGAGFGIGIRKELSVEAVPDQSRSASKWRKRNRCWRVVVTVDEQPAGPRSRSSGCRIVEPRNDHLTGCGY